MWSSHFLYVYACVCERAREREEREMERLLGGVYKKSLITAHLQVKKKKTGHIGSRGERGECKKTGTNRSRYRRRCSLLEGKRESIYFAHIFSYTKWRLYQWQNQKYKWNILWVCQRLNNAGHDIRKGTTIST